MNTTRVVGYTRRFAPVSTLAASHSAVNVTSCNEHGPWPGVGWYPYESSMKFETAWLNQYLLVAWSLRHPLRRAAWSGPDVGTIASTIVSSPYRVRAYETCDPPPLLPETQNPHCNGAGTIPRGA